MIDIFVPSRTLIEPRDALIIPSRLRGWFKIEAVKADGRRRLLADWFPNLVTDNGLNLIGTTNSWLNDCFVGSGNTAPANTDTALQSLVGTTAVQFATAASSSGSSPWFGARTTTYRFAAGTATGNLAEVGVGANATGLFSRALILDGGGSPTTITVLSSEALDVTYSLQNQAPITDVTGSVVIGGVSYNYTVRAANANSAGLWAVASTGDTGGFRNNGTQATNGAIGAVTSGPSGSASTADSVTNAAYSNGSLLRQATAFWGLTVGNLSGGISAFLCQLGIVATMGEIQIGLSASIPKDASHTLSMTFQHSWARFP